MSNYCSLLLFALLLRYSLNPVPVLVHARDDNPPGFVSIDCGLGRGSAYKDSTTGLYYKSDADLIDGGESKNLSFATDEKYLSTLRSFPQGKKNCYTIQPSPGKGNKYLIRATFMYGNYDSLNQLPTFHLNLGPDTWSAIAFKESSDVVTKEIIHVLSSDYLHVCLIKTGPATPFISALELRPLNSADSPYSIGSTSLQMLERKYCDIKGSHPVFRYKDDNYDRIWKPQKVTATRLTTWLDLNNTSPSHVPVSVLRTACESDRNVDSLMFGWETTNNIDECYVYMYFTEIKTLETNELREFDIYINDEKWSDQPIVPPYLSVTGFYPPKPNKGNTEYKIKLKKTANSTLQPIINAYEVYMAKQFPNKGTHDTDVSAILNVKSKYQAIRDWQGDPCQPEGFLWDGLQCSSPSSNHSARIISLNLSTSKLTGEILLSIADLTQLKTLDLSHNNLKGQVPEFLSCLPLRVLNLTGNKFTGPIPAQLLENQKNGILVLSYDNSRDEMKNNKLITAIVGTALGSVFLVAILSGIWIERGRVMRVFKNWGKQPRVNISDMERKNRQFTYSQVVDITKSFQVVLGEGGFGKVYHGCVDGIEVAVKMLSPSSTQGYIEFQTEASLLMMINHKNLTSLVGYCYEGIHMGIIYEYMAKQSLDKYLSGNSDGISSWKIRLKIALDAARG